jgi:hypothetical protein
VYWPKDISRFNHDETGYKLTGKHRNLKCNQCHTRKNIRGADIIAWAQKNPQYPVLDRTFLGLEEACTSCHEDVHRGEVDSDCTGCHDTQGWERARQQVDHSRTRFQLEGAHQQVACEKCHRPHTDWSPPVPQLSGLVFDRCTGCHEDVHRGEVTKDCVACHDNTDWHNVRKTFDHSQAKFHLTGAHRSVECEKCHQPHVQWQPPVPRLTGLPFEYCTGCHTDPHTGNYGSNCETCHTTGDWKKELKPFDHSTTRYPLSGKHTQVKCEGCHTRELQGKLPRFDRCLACHQDQHYGQFTQRSDRGDCGACHTVEGFKPTTFTIAMHQSARLPLDGSHLAVPCVFCHKSYEPLPGIITPRFTWDSVSCQMCHEDVHRGQFFTHYRNDCAACHTTILFSRPVFDHQTTNFPLDGRHVNVACEMCHNKESDDEGIFTRYYPVAHRCVDCHTITEDIR